MITLRKLTHEDYDAVVEICKDIWDGTDYLPQIFHSWVDDQNGLFMGAIDSNTDKVVGVDKYSVLADGSGWLEGLRVHKDYRGQKIAKLLAEYVLNHAILALQKGEIQRLAFSTFITSVESINMMKQYGFQLEQQHILVRKDFDKLDPKLSKSDFVIKSWDASFEDFAQLPFIQRRSGIFHIAFWFQQPNRELFDYLKEHDSFVEINGHKGIYLFKGEPHFVTEEEGFEAINTFTNYYLLDLKEYCNCPPFFSVMKEDTSLIEQLKAAGYSTWTDWQADYYYFVKK